jgi:hypothetical protein
MGIARISAFLNTAESNQRRFRAWDKYSKESGPREPGIGLTPGRGRSVTELISTFYWSFGVLENRTHNKHLPGIKP